MMVRMGHAGMLVLAFVTAVVLTGCKAEEGKSTGFTTTAMMDRDPSLPFHKVWRKPGIDFTHYKKLYVAPVNTEYMLAQTDWQKGMRKEEIETDVKALADYTKQTVEKAFKEDP